MSWKDGFEETRSGFLGVRDRLISAVSLYMEALPFHSVETIVSIPSFLGYECNRGSSWRCCSLLTYLLILYEVGR